MSAPVYPPVRSASPSTPTPPSSGVLFRCTRKISARSSANHSPARSVAANRSAAPVRRSQLQRGTCPSRAAKGTLHPPPVVRQAPAAVVKRLLQSHTINR
eukprot:490867-Prorocentrum_minimum.AAC.1